MEKKFCAEESDPNCAAFYEKKLSLQSYNFK